MPPVNDEVSASTWTATLRGFNEHPNTPPSRQRRRLTFPSCVCVCACAIVFYTSVCGSANTSPLCACGSVKRERERFCANTSSVRVRIYVTEADVGRCPYVHITIERSLRHLCHGIYCVA